ILERNMFPLSPPPAPAPLRLRLGLLVLAPFCLIDQPSSPENKGTTTSRQWPCKLLGPFASARCQIARSRSPLPTILSRYHPGLARDRGHTPQPASQLPAPARGQTQLRHAIDGVEPQSERQIPGLQDEKARWQKPQPCAFSLMRLRDRPSPTKLLPRSIH